jgi:hypothetical protein
MGAQQRIVFAVTPAEADWFARLVQASGGTRIELFRALLDAYAKQIGFEPRPK